MRQAVALAETIHHHERFMAATHEDPGWTSDFRVLIGSVDLSLDDVNAVPEVLHPTMALRKSRGADCGRLGATD